MQKRLEKGSSRRGKVLKTFDRKKWFKNYRAYMKDISRALSPDGRFHKQFVLPLGEQNENSKYDEQAMKEFCRLKGYKVEDSLWASGLVTQTNSGDTKIIQVAESFVKNIEENYQKIEDRKDKLLEYIKSCPQEHLKSTTKKISKYQELQDEMKRHEAVVNDYIYVAKKMRSSYSLVFCFSSQLVAMQSTDTAWRSCMDLDGGAHSDKVGSGISEGTFIVYLTLSEDAERLRGPLARVLVKPFRSKEGKVYWFVDQVYPRGTKNYFRSAVAKLLDERHNKFVDDGHYKLPSGVYNDGVNEMKIDDIYRYVQIGDFSDLMNQSSEFLETMFERHGREVLRNWDKKTPFPNITVKNLDASGMDLREFPKGITVTGNLNLSNTNIETLFE
jgi:hypothetical protein